MIQLVVYTDLDGCLLDSTTYSYEPAAPALEALRARHIPLVLVSSKTRAEIEPLRHQLGHRDPFIVENGAAVFVPHGLFDFPLERARARTSYDVIELGLPYGILREVLKQIEKTVATPLRGFGDLSVEEIMQLTGLTQQEALLAKEREYDEPYLLEGPPALIEEVCRQIVTRGLRWTKGGRFHHILGHAGKRPAVSILASLYRRWNPAVHIAGCGDSINDTGMLTAVDLPILVQKPDGNYDDAVARMLPAVQRSPRPGPSGWNVSVRHLLAEMNALPARRSAFALSARE